MMGALMVPVMPAFHPLPCLPFSPHREDKDPAKKSGTCTGNPLFGLSLVRSQPSSDLDK